MVLQGVRLAGAQTLAITGGELVLPFYDPAVPVRSEVAHRLVHALRRADGVVLVSPGYHGTVSGLVKNALNSTEVSFDDHGGSSDPAVERTLRTIGQQVVQFAQEHSAGTRPGWP